MPPALSDEEASASESEIPFREKNTKAGAEAEEAEDEEGEDEYVVEKILNHAFGDDGICLYEVKWLGYEKKSDRTWEPEDNLEGAVDVLQEYWKSIGGRPKPGDAPPSKSKKRSRKSAGVKEEAGEGTLASSAKKHKRVEEEERWEPPPGSWEQDVDYIETVEENPDPKTGETKRYCYVMWNNGKRTQHELIQINKKCPQKMLRYYEQHLVFRVGEDVKEETNGAF